MMYTITTIDTNFKSATIYICC